MSRVPPGHYSYFVSPGLLQCNHLDVANKLHWKENDIDSSVGCNSHMS